MKIKFGIIGLGVIAKRFASALQLVEDAELVGVASRDKAKSEQFAKDYNAKIAYESYEDLLKNSDADVIYIATTHNFHYEIAKLCISYKKGILCEKPFFTNKKEAEEIFILAKVNNTFIMEATWTRCLPAFLKAKEWVNSKRIGDLKIIDIYFCFYREYNIESRLYNPYLAGGALYDIGVYAIEFITGITGNTPKKLNSIATKAESGVDNCVSMQMLFDNDVIGNATCSISISIEREASIFGTNGYIKLNSCCSAKKCEIFDNEHNLIESFEDDEEEGFVYQIRHVVKLLNENKLQSDLIPMRDTIDCAEIFDKVKIQCDLLP